MAFIEKAFDFQNEKDWQYQIGAALELLDATCFDVLGRLVELRRSCCLHQGVCLAITRKLGLTAC